MTDRPLTTSDVAAALRCSPRHVRYLATRHNVGTQLTPRQLIFRPDEVEHLRRMMASHRPGRPRSDG